MNPLYITEILLALVAGGVITRFIMRPKKPKPPKHRCPWDPCGYPLSDTPLVSKLENEKYYATYASEECQGCGNLVIWDRFRNGYIRYKPLDKIGT